MVTIPQVAEAMQSVLSETARQQGHASGFVQRPGKLDGATWTQTLVLGWLADPEATLDGLAQTAALLGVAITPQGLDERFSPAAAACVRAVLEAGVQQLLAAQPAALPVLQRFRGVYIQDSTQIALPAELGTVWRGNGGKDSGAALKLQVQWEWLSGQLVRLDLQNGRAADGAAPAQAAPLPAGALRLADLGYFNLDVLAATAAQQAFFLTRWKVGTLLYSAQGEQLDLLAWLQRQPSGPVDVAVQVGQRHRLPARLLAVAVPSVVAAERRRRLRRAAQEQGKTVSAERLALAAWTLLLTNVPADQLSVDEALVVAACRWQIELLFKLWKSHGRLDESRSTKPWRQLTELYAKLLGLLIQHWLWLLSCWSHPNRSLRKAAKTVQKFAWNLAAALTCLPDLLSLLAQIQRTLSVGCRTNTRRHELATFQTLLICAGQA